MPKISLGSEELAALYVGSEEIIEAYVGADLVYQKAGGPPAAITGGHIAGHYDDETNRSTYTWTTPAVGALGSNRRMLLHIHLNTLGNSISSGSIDGNAITVHAGQRNNQNLTAICSAAIPTGTGTLSASLTLTGTGARIGVEHFVFYGISASHNQAKTDVSSPFTQTLSCAAGGLMLACFGSANNNTHTISDGSFSEDYDGGIIASDPSSGTMATYSALFATAQTDLSLTITPSGTATQPTAAFASFDPA